MALAALLALGGCATRPGQPADHGGRPWRSGYTFQARRQKSNFRDTSNNLVVLAFSGGGTRAAAFSYGVLEFLRRTEVDRPERQQGSAASTRSTSSPACRAAASPRSPTASTATSCSPTTSSASSSATCRASSSPARSIRSIGATCRRRAGAVPNWRPQLYDEILFNGATFGDLDRGDGPFIMASATDISSGGRVTFNQNVFERDVLGSRMRSGCRAPLPRRPPCRSCCRRSRSTTTAAPATIDIPALGRSCSSNPESAAARPRARYAS